MGKISDARINGESSDPLVFPRSFFDSGRTGKPADSSGNFEPPQGLFLDAAAARKLFTELSEAVKASAEKGGDGWLDTWQASPAFVRHCLLRSAEPHDRALLIKNLLEISNQSSAAGPAILKVIEGSRSLLDAREVIDEVGGMNLALSPHSRHFIEQVILVDVWPSVKGTKGLPDPTSLRSEDEARDACELLGLRLKENAELFVRAALDRSDIPVIPAANSHMLFEEFRIRRDVEQPYSPEIDDLSVEPIGDIPTGDFQSYRRRSGGSDEERERMEDRYSDTDDLRPAAGLYEVYYRKLEAFFASGLGLLDGDRHWKPAEAEQAVAAIREFPETVFFFQGIALNIVRCHVSEREPRNAASTVMGKIFLYDAGVEDVPPHDLVEVNLTKRALVHELGHCCHTIFHEEFKMLSGWGYLRESESTLLRDGRVRFEGAILKSGDEFIKDGVLCKLSVTERGPNYYRSGARFVNDYAASDPFEDYAESLAMFVLNPNGLKLISPEKFQFMSYVYGRGVF